MSEISRTFVNAENINTATAIIQIDNKEELHHLINVVRAKINQEIMILDNSGFEYKTLIKEITNTKILTQITDRKFIYKYPKFFSTLIQSGIKSSKLETVVQKATELGIDKIIIVRSDYSNSDIHQSSSKCNRLEKIILSATKQCKRSTLAQLSFEDSIDEVLSKTDFLQEEALNFAFIEGNNIKHLKDIVKQVNTSFVNMNIFIGPEGGWSEREKKLFSKYNLNEVSLGKNILRSETASILALGILFYEFEDYA